MNKQELQSLLEGVRTALTGNQSKLDRNQNNKIDREDFTLLRSKKPMAENADLLALLEHLYGVLLDQKAARLNEWEQPNSASHRWVKGAQANARRGQTSDPTNFYQGNREDNDEIRMSIVRAAAEEKRKEEEEKERQRLAKNENVQYNSILEKIYTALTEADAPPDYPQPPATWPRDKNGDLINWPWPNKDNPPGWVLPNDRTTKPIWGPDPNGIWGPRPSWWQGSWPPVPPFSPYKPNIPNSPFEIRPDYIRPQWKPIVPDNQAD